MQINDGSGKEKISLGSFSYKMRKVDSELVRSFYKN